MCILAPPAGLPLSGATSFRVNLGFVWQIPWFRFQLISISLSNQPLRPLISKLERRKSLSRRKWVPPKGFLERRILVHWFLRWLFSLALNLKKKERLTDRTLHNTKLAKPFRDSSRISRGIDWLTVRICTLHLSLEAQFTQIGISGRGPALCHVSLLGYIWRKIARSGGKPRRSLSCRLDRYRPKGTAFLLGLLLARPAWRIGFLCLRIGCPKEGLPVEPAFLF